MLVPIMLNLPAIPTVALIPPAEVVRIAETRTSHQAQSDGPVPVADCLPSTPRHLLNDLPGSVLQQNAEPGSQLIENTDTHNHLQKISCLPDDTREPGNPEGLQCVPVHHQSEVIPAGQQLPSQCTDCNEGERAKCLSAEQQLAGLPATNHSIPTSMKPVTSNSENLTSEVHGVTTSETNQPLNSSDDESTKTDVITTTQCKNSPADVNDRTEKASTDMKQGSQVAEEDEQNSSGNDSGKCGDSTSSTKHAKSNKTVSSAAGKAVGKRASRKGSKVIVNISETTYFMSRKRWSQLQKQWYVLIQCQSK